MSTALVWSVVAVAGLLVTGGLFWVGGQIVHVKKASFGRATLSALFCGIVVAAVLAMLFILSADPRADAGLLVTHSRWLGAVLVMVASVAILRNGFETTFPKAMAVWCCAVGIIVALGTLLMPAVALLVDLLSGGGDATSVAFR